MNIHQRNVAQRMRGMAAGVISISFLFSVTSALPVESQEAWNCEETAFYSIYEDISRTKGKESSKPKALNWIDADTIGFESTSLKRVDPKSDTYFSQSSGAYLQINQTERPYLVVLTQPQIWMNKFGNLRVRFYRCTPEN